MPRRRDADLLAEAVAADGEAFRLMLDGRPDEARRVLRRAAALYRASWEAAPPRAFGRLVAMMTSALLAGDAGEAAAFARRELGGVADSPTSAYAQALAALIEGRDDDARAPAETMRRAGGAFGRAGDAVAALAAGDGPAYARAVAAIVDDFAARDAHLTGVAVADTAMALEVLAGRRGMAADPPSPLMPPRPEAPADRRGR
jgi:hypothetical protein